ncbi:ATP-grasp domain-containing protein [Bradyrhizobium diazoefficiens]
MTSSSVRPATKALFDEIGKLGYKPIVITRETNRAKIESDLGPPALDLAIFCSNLEDPLSTSAQVERALQMRGLHLRSLINVVDLLTPSMLMTCERIGLSFAFLETYRKCRNKPRARAALRAVGLSSLRSELIDVFDEWAAPSLAYPFVAKPVMGAGSALVYRVGDAEQWEKYRNYFRTLVTGAREQIDGVEPFRQVMVEEFANGQMFQVDGFCFAGELHVCGLGLKFHEVVDGCFKQGFREIGGMQYRPFSIPEHADMDGHIVGWARSVCAALEFRSGTFHLEGMLCSNGIELIEINPRPGGSEVVSIVEKISGVNLSRQVPRLWMEEAPTQFPGSTATQSVLYAILYPPGPTKIRAIRPAQSLGTSIPNAAEALWLPEKSLEAGSPVGEADGEEYLGEVHIPCYMPTDTASLRHDVESLAHWASQDARLIEFEEISRGE